MRLHLLGTGTCLGPPRGGAARQPPLFALELGEPGDAARTLVLDCSEGARFRLAAAGIDPSRVRHVAVSHPHADHAVLPPFLQGRSCEALVRGAARDELALALYLPRASAEAFHTVLRWHEPESDGRTSTRWDLELVPVDDGFARELWPGVVLRAFSVWHGHGKNPALAYRIEAGGRVLAYSGDSGPCEGVARAAAGADLFLCEASARVGHDMSAYGHLGPRQAGEIARAAGARHLVLTHYHGTDAAEAIEADARASGFAGALDVAADGTVILVP
jgi:ribonuclease BN (tRNA processing enzyme)